MPFASEGPPASSADEGAHRPRPPPDVVPQPAPATSSSVRIYCGFGVRLLSCLAVEYTLLRIRALLVLFVALVVVGFVVGFVAFGLASFRFCALQ